MVGDFTFVVTKEDKLLRIDIASLHGGLSTDTWSMEGLHESTVCDGVDLLASDGKSVTLLSTDARLFDLQRPDLRLDLKAVCGHAKWSAISRRGDIIMTSGWREIQKSLLFVLVDAASMTVRHKLEVAKKVTDSKAMTKHIRFVDSNERLFAVASRDYQFVDIIEIVAGGRLTTDAETRTAVDVTGGKDLEINSLVEHPTNGNGVLVAGDKFMQALFVEAGRR